MSTLKNNIDNKLYKCELIEESINNLLDGVKEFEEKGGTAKFILYPKDGHMCESIITEETVEAFIEILLSEYIDKLKSIKNEINNFIDLKIKDLSLIN